RGRLCRSAVQRRDRLSRAAAGDGCGPDRRRPMIKSIAIAALALAACSKSADTPVGSKRGAKLEYPVDVAPLEARAGQYSGNAPGTIDAFQQVQITARVSGAVDKVMFAEGQNVKQSDVLVTIDGERYQIAVSQAQSVLAKSQAAEKAAEAALDRRLEAQKASP